MLRNSYEKLIILENFGTFKELQVYRLHAKKSIILLNNFNNIKNLLRKSSIFHQFRHYQTSLDLSKQV